MELRELPLFAGVEAAQIGPIEQRLTPARVPAGDALMSTDDPADFFAIVLGGRARVEVEAGDTRREVATLQRGDIVGELGLLTGRRSSTVVAETDLDVLTGDADAFEAMLANRELHERIQDLVSRRFAQNLRPVQAQLKDGTSVWLRPLLPTDREMHHKAVREASAQTLLLRFFTPAQPSEKVLDYLVDIDFVDHFAWVCVNADGTGVGIVRYIRDKDDHDEAEIAFATDEAWRGRGVGTLMVGAIAVAAKSAGIDTITGIFLAENRGSRALFRKAGATFGRAEPGVVSARAGVDDAIAVLAADIASALQSAVEDIVTAGDLALSDAGTPG